MREQSIAVQQRAALLEARTEKKVLMSRTLGDLEEEVGMAGSELCFLSPGLATLRASWATGAVGTSPGFVVT